MLVCCAGELAGNVPWEVKRSSKMMTMLMMVMARMIMVRMMMVRVLMMMKLLLILVKMIFMHVGRSCQGMEMQYIAWENLHFGLKLTLCPRFILATFVNKNYHFCHGVGGIYCTNIARIANAVQCHS